MSTRGTYQFVPIESNPRFKHKTTVYIHHDNYPTGAAAYFYETLMNYSCGGFATQFLRAIENAEITAGHDVHGDTEYRYDVEGEGPAADLAAYHRKWVDGEGRSSVWELIFHGLLHEFIAQNTKHIEDFKPFVTLRTSRGYVEVTNETRAAKGLAEEYSCLGH